MILASLESIIHKLSTKLGKENANKDHLFEELKLSQIQQAKDKRAKNTNQLLTNECNESIAW